MSARIDPEIGVVTTARRSPSSHRQSSVNRKSILTNSTYNTVSGGGGGSSASTTPTSERFGSSIAHSGIDDADARTARTAPSVAESYQPGSLEFEMTWAYMQQTWSPEEYHQAAREVAGDTYATPEEQGWSDHEEFVQSPSNPRHQSRTPTGEEPNGQDDTRSYGNTAGESPRRLSRQVSFNSHSGAGGGGGNELLRISVMNRAVEASGRPTSIGPSIRSPTPIHSGSALVASPSLSATVGGSGADSDASRRVLSSTASVSSGSSVYSGSYRSLSGGLHYPELSQPIPVAGAQAYPHDAAHNSFAAPRYINLPMPNYDADDIEEELRLQQQYAREVPLGAVLFAFGFILCPLWWIGAMMRVEGEELLRASDKGKSQEQPNCRGTGEAVRKRARALMRWRTLNRIMSVISFILLAATVGLLLWWYYRYQIV